MKKILLALTVVTLILSFCICVFAAADYHVYNPVDLQGHVTVSGGLTIADPTLSDNGKLYLSIQSNKDGASSNSQTMITIDTASLAPNVKASEYPVMKVSYRSNVAAQGAQVTANIGVDYNNNGTVVGAKFFTKFITYDRTNNVNSFMYNYKDCTSGEVVNPFSRLENFSTSNVLASSIYNFIILKTYVSNLNMVKGETFDIEYIGFFKSVADANAYVHSVDIENYPVTNITLREQVMRIVKGDTYKLNVQLAPTFIPVGSNVTYQSSNASVATVDANGVVTGIKKGTATITATANGIISSCKIHVLDAEIAPLNLYDKSANKTNYIVNSIGDSITTYVPNPDGGMQYHKYWSQWYNITNNNYGVSGTTINPRSGRTDSFLERYSSMRDDADLVTVKGGTNDWGTSFAVGTLNDREATTLMGGVRLLMEGLIEKYPDKQIVFFTPIRRGESGQTEATKNSKGFTLRDYSDAIIELGEIYGIPVIDLYAPEELDFTSPVITPSGKDENGKWHDAVCESDLMPDGLHPSGKGQKIMATYMMSEMVRLGVFTDYRAAKGGDVNNDGTIEASDCVTLIRALANWGGYNVNQTAADVNKDGVIDTRDAIYLARHLAGWKNYETIPTK